MSGGRFFASVSDAIKEGKSWVYVYGFVQYEDVHRRKFILHYCARYLVTEGQFEYCEKGNNSNQAN